MAETKKKVTAVTEPKKEEKMVKAVELEAAQLELQHLKETTVSRADYEKVVRAFNRLFEMYQKEQSQKLLNELLKDEN